MNSSKAPSSPRTITARRVRHPHPSLQLHRPHILPQEMFDYMMKKRREESESTNYAEKIKMHNANVDRDNANKSKNAGGPGRKRRKNRGKR